MPDLTAKRTLVKSPPELWSELSEVERLARHLGAFGEIKITKLEPEHTVAWEGEGASGTVSIEPSGWGTKVTLTAQLGEAEIAEATSGDEEPRVEKPVVADVTLEEPSAPETAAGEEVEGAAVSGEAEDLTREVGGSARDVDEALAAAEEPVFAECPPVDEPPARAPVEPVAATPRRKRGFLGWLFRQRTSAQVAASPVPAPSEPVAEAQAPEEPPIAEEPPAGESLTEEQSVAEEPSVTKEPPLVEEPPVDAESPAKQRPPAEERVAAEQSPIAEDRPVVEESPGLEEPAQLDESSTDEGAAEASRLDPEGAQAILDGALDALGSAHHRPFSRG